MSSWKILIERGNLEFSAAHFITFEGECEPLHGHNYGVRVEAAGELTTDSYVVDFVVMKDIVRTLIKRWDHRFLLPLENPYLRVSEQEDAWEIEFAGEPDLDQAHRIADKLLANLVIEDFTVRVEETAPAATP